AVAEHGLANTFWHSDIQLLRGKVCQAPGENTSSSGGCNCAGSTTGKSRSGLRRPFQFTFKCNPNPQSHPSSDRASNFQSCLSCGGGESQFHGGDRKLLDAVFQKSRLEVRFGETIFRKCPSLAARLPDTHHRAGGNLRRY